MVELPSQPLADIDPEFRAIALETGEWTYGLSGTSTREKLLLNLANDVCREHLPPERATKAPPVSSTGARRAGKVPRKVPARRTGACPASSRLGPAGRGRWRV